MIPDSVIWLYNVDGGGGVELYVGIYYYFTFQFRMDLCVYHLELMMQVSAGSPMGEVLW